MNKFLIELSILQLQIATINLQIALLNDILKNRIDSIRKNK